MSAHATALVNRDVEVLERSSQSFEQLGWLLLAAEAAAEAMAICDDAGRRDRARVNAARARALADGCEGARTPAFRALDGTTGLSAREARDRDPRGRGSLEPGHRNPVAPLSADGRQPSAPRVHEARCGGPGRARRRAQARLSSAAHGDSGCASATASASQRRSSAASSGTTASKSSWSCGRVSFAFQSSCTAGETYGS